MSEKEKSQEYYKKEALEMRFRELEKEWDQTLLEILKSKYKKAGKEIPELEEKELLEKAPYFLEEITEDKLKEKKGKNQFLVFSGAAGVGKGTIIKELKKGGILFLPHITDRLPRPNEKEGIDYFFVSSEDFDKKIKKGEFFQWRKTYGARRGVSKKIFLQWVKEGKKFVFERSVPAFFEFNQKKEVKALKFLSIYILPPSFNELKIRISHRPGIETQEQILRRIEESVDHLKALSLIEEIKETSDPKMIEEKKNLIRKMLKTKEKLEVLPTYHTFLVNDQIPRVSKKIIENI